MNAVNSGCAVVVPASSANLGPGFDAFGLALSLRDELIATEIPSGLEINVTGEGAGDVPSGPEHLVVRAMEAAFAHVGARPTGVRLTCTNAIPHARGLGSSSAAIVGGLALGGHLVGHRCGHEHDADLRPQRRHDGRDDRYRRRHI